MRAADDLRQQIADSPRRAAGPAQPAPSDGGALDVPSQPAYNTVIPGGAPIRA